MYKSFIGIFDFDESGMLFTGEATGLRAVITFKGRTIEELERSFHDSVDLYLQMIRDDEIQPPKKDAETIKPRKK